MIQKLIKMDKVIRTGVLLGYFFVTALFILFFMSLWLLPLPFIFIFLLVYTSSKAEELELAKNNNNSV